MNKFYQDMRNNINANDADVIARLRTAGRVSADTRANAHDLAKEWVNKIRKGGETGLMDVFMAEYGLSTEEGISLMCLAEALLRVPDAETMSALIEDKIAPSNWSSHLGKSSSTLVNASTWALMLTGKVLDEDRPMAGVLTGAIKRVGEPVIRQAVRRAMRELGAQFVLGQDIEAAIKNGKSARKQGYTYSYDMLGEAAMTARDAKGFFASYKNAITELAKHAKSDDIRENPGISIKLSALFERYEQTHEDRVMAVLVPRVLQLAQAAKAANMGLNIDAEEADRLELSMKVIEAVAADPSLANWDGFGIVVQAYGKRASYVIEWFNDLATRLDRKFMLRLVKGAYWDTEIKRAQVEGLDGFPVFATKPATDVAYIENAARLLEITDRIYPQFATHNAHTVAMIKTIAGARDDYEFQRLHGMGDGLYHVVMKAGGTRCRIYAPVGVHRDLLAYLVRRLLENGANSSFVNQILDEEVPAATVAACPYMTFDAQDADLPDAVISPARLFGARKNSRGFDLHNPRDLEIIEAARAPFKSVSWQAASITVKPAKGGDTITLQNPANGQPIGTVQFASVDDVTAAIGAAKPWDAPVAERAAALRRAADLFEDNFGQIFAMLTREAGKTTRDGIAELREAVDFLRFYADEAERKNATPRGIFACISPWNFPLAIFIGQISAALAQGNAVLAKPAESTPIIGHFAVQMMHQAGVPVTALQYLPGLGSDVGAALSADRRINGVCFTGSTATAQMINRSMAANLDAGAPLIAETGGLNAMIVDSTALPEQAVRDIVISSFQSAGQRCSALRVLYLQEDIADRFLGMLYGAMDALDMGDPWDMRTDVGPVIDTRAYEGIAAHIAAARGDARVLRTVNSPSKGHFIAPTVIEVNGIADLEREIFGPVLHVARFKASDLDEVVDDINATGYGLTFGMHSRIDDRVDQVTSRIKAGNVYINRNQIGAIVGSQPFGGEGMSGTGPKAGGPLYVDRFAQPSAEHGVIRSEVLPGPTGESNQWRMLPRGVIVCAGPTAEDVLEQAIVARAQGCEVIEGLNDVDALRSLENIHGVVYWGDDGGAYRAALASREGAILPLITAREFAPWCWVERHTCIDTTAAGGNAALLAGAA